VGERLRLFDVDLARIALDELPSDIDVLQTKRDDRLVARARQNGKGDDSAVALGDFDDEEGETSTLIWSRSRKANAE